MGNFLQTLQGVFQPQQQPDLLEAFRPDLAGPGGFAGPTGMTESVMGFPSVARSGISETGAIPRGDYSEPMEALSRGEGPPALPEQADITVNGWRPKKPTILGAIADAYLMSNGGQPMFTKMRNQEDMIKAMKGFTNDPKEAIRRIGMIPGMQEKAWDMYNQQFDNETQRASQDRMNRSLDMRNEDYMYNYVANMMGTATEETWPTMRELAIKRAVARGMDPIQIEALIPPTFDPTSVEYIRYGQIKNKDQIAIKQRDRRLDQQETTIENTQNYRERRLEQIDEAEEGRNERNTVNEQGRNARSPRRGTSSGDPRYIKTERGWMNLSPSGNYGTIDNGTEIEMWKKTSPGKWERIGTKPKKGQ